MKIIIAIYSMLLSGCSASKPRVIRYPFATVVLASGNTVSQECSGIPGKWDNGKPKPRWAPVAGCAFLDRMEAWVDENAPMCVLLHELAHLFGIKDPEAEGYGCRQ